MACKDEIPVTIEYTRVLFGAGTLVDPTPICRQIDQECCADAGDPTCCDGEFTAELAATLSGPLDGTCGPESVALTLTWDATDQRWYGEALNASETYSFRVWFRCVNGVYTGTVQVLDSDGALIDESPDIVLGPTCDSTPPTLDGSYAPEGDLAPCGDNVVISIDHPCPLQCGGVPAVPCCPDGFTEILSATLDPIGALTVTYNPVWGVWDGAVANGDDTFVATLWCDGENWQMALDLYTDGELVDSDYQALAPGPDCTTLVAGPTVGGEAFSFETEHPCPPTPCGDPGGTHDLCGCTGISDNVSVTFSGPLSEYGMLTLAWDGFTMSWRVTPGVTTCNLGTSPVALTCAGGTTWTLSSPGSGGGTSTSFSANATASSCSPLSIAFSGTATGTCAGAWSATVSEIAP